MTNLGKRCNLGTLEIVCCDPPAEVYRELLAEHSVDPPHAVHPVEGERLTTVFSENSFDLTFSNNAIDHAHDPIAVVSEMLKVTKVGRYVFIQVAEDEGKGARYRGLHQWNCEIREGRFLILGRSEPEVDIGKEFAAIAKIVELRHVFVNPAGLPWNRPHIRAVLEKLE